MIVIFMMNVMKQIKVITSIKAITVKDILQLKPTVTIAVPSQIVSRHFQIQNRLPQIQFRTPWF
mgnify:CR=1 FL=1